MTEDQARALRRTIEELLDGKEVGLLRVEEEPPGHWGVTIRLTSKYDWPALSGSIVAAVVRG